MSDIIISSENLGKKYVIGHQTERGSYTTLRDVLVQNARTLWSKTKDLVSGKPIIQGNTLEEVWALKNVSFEIRRGEAVGIIGRNGAGKSTLLKVLSRITEPSTGRVTIQGRVASLLEVGTGFHPELTGRENIYLNGTILGMTRKEIKRKFDEIVAFAEVEQYLDTPVKRYSSGMYVRLAFSVAAHLEPEILVVDEVLAVGDAAFQKKCLGKMSEVAKTGRTVLFVSHNMGAVQSLTSRTLLLDSGRKVALGPTSTVIEGYLSDCHNLSVIDADEAARTSKDYGTLIRFIRVELDTTEGKEIPFGSDIKFKIELKAFVSMTGLRFGLTVLSALHTPILSAFTDHQVQTKEGSNNKYIVSLRDTGLAPGQYYIAISVGFGSINQGQRNHDHIMYGPSFAVGSVSRLRMAINRWDPSWGFVYHENCIVEPLEEDTKG